MGRTLPSATQLIHQEEAELAHFRRALRRDDQLAFDDLLTTPKSISRPSPMLLMPCPSNPS